MSSPFKVPAERRIFVGSGFVTGDVSELLFEWIRRFLEQQPQALALLEFTSPGPARRQIDCVLIGPGGIDLIEVKDKRGVVCGSAEGEWTVQDHSGTAVFSNLKGGRSENPFVQADSAARDLETGLRRLTGARIRVTPLVLLPAPDSRSVVEPRHSRVSLALEIGALKRTLRSADRPGGGGWNGVHPQALPERLGLRPFDLAFVAGRVVSALTRTGVPDVTVRVGGDGECFSVESDLHGRYAFSATSGRTLRLELAVPERYAPPEAKVLITSSRSVQVPDLCLKERSTPEDLEAAYQSQRAALEAQFLRRVSQLADDRLDEQAQLGLFIDVLGAELKRARQRITGLEAEAGRAQLGKPPLVLPGGANSGGPLRRLHADQDHQIAQVLSLLTSTDSETRRRAVEPGTRLLASISLEPNHALPGSDAAPESATLVGFERMPVQLPADLKEETGVVDVESVLSAPRRRAPPERSATVRPGRAVWWTIGILGVLVVGGGLKAWTRSDGAVAPVENTSAFPAPSSAPVGAESLPGVPADLPGVFRPVRSAEQDNGVLPGTPVLP